MKLMSRESRLKWARTKQQVDRDPTVTGGQMVRLAVQLSISEHPIVLNKHGGFSICDRGNLAFHGQNNMQSAFL